MRVWLLLERNMTSMIEKSYPVSSPSMEQLPCSHKSSSILDCTRRQSSGEKEGRGLYFVNMSERIRQISYTCNMNDWVKIGMNVDKVVVVGTIRCNVGDGCEFSHRWG